VWKLVFKTNLFVEREQINETRSVMTISEDEVSEVEVLSILGPLYKSGET